MRKTLQFFTLLVIVNLLIGVLEYIFADLILDISALLQILIPAFILSVIYYIIRLFIGERVVFGLPNLIFLIYVLLLINLYIQTSDFSGNLGFYYLNIFYATLPIRIESIFLSFGISKDLAFLVGQVFFPPLYVHLLIKMLDTFVNWQRSFTS